MQYTYKDFYGCKAVITTYPKGNTDLQIWASNGEKVVDKPYKNFAAARSVLGRFTEGTAKLVETKSFLK